jgi:hypothetical protein
MNALTLPLSNRLLLLVAPHAAGTLMLELAARLSLNGSLRVLDGGNRFNIYPVARNIRRYTPELTGALARIHLSRAFTCYQMTGMLSEAAEDGLPTLVLDFLATFYDENVTLSESQRLLRECLPHLKRISRRAPVVVSVKPPAPLCTNRSVLVDLLVEQASQSWTLEPLPVPAPQMLWD